MSGESVFPVPADARLWFSLSSPVSMRSILCFLCKGRGVYVAVVWGPLQGQTHTLMAPSTQDVLDVMIQIEQDSGEQALDVQAFGAELDALDETELESILRETFDLSGVGDDS